jgi:protein phosphatase
VLSTIGVIAFGLVAALWWLSNQWFVGVYTKDGVVAIFQGVPAGGMYRLVEISGVPAIGLPEFEREQVYQTFDAEGLEGAQTAVERLKVSADLCIQTPSTPGCPEIAP